MSILISIEDLLSGDLVEGTRMEFKKGWNPAPIMRSVCAFANDFENEGSGYIIVGCDEENGKPIRPVHGFDPNLLEKVEKEIIGYCNLIKPSYFPRLSLEQIDEKYVLVIWVPAGSNRPYKVPDDVIAKHKNYNFRIRYRSNSIVPNNELETELIQLTAKIPFDDRVSTHVNIEDLSFSLMREHLEKTKSKLYTESAFMSIEELAEKMNLSQGANEHLFPKNVGLLMFSKNPEQYFKGAKIDLVEFPNGVAGKEFNEKFFSGPIQKQLIDILSYIKSNLIKSKIVKYAHTEKVDQCYNYPFNAVEEALSNAVYHRNYELLDPIEVRILPTAIEIISYNGVDPSLKQADFDNGIVRARRYRNRRIGDFLKELRLTEGRGTGIPTIVKALSENGSPHPIFDANEPERTHFIVEIPIHQAFIEQEKETFSNFTGQSDQVSDQVSDQDIELIIKDLDELNALSSSNELIKTDLVTDPEDSSVNLVPFKYDALIKHILSISKLIPDDKLTDKYKGSAINITNEQLQILKFTSSPKSNKEIQEECLKLKTHTDNFKNHIEPLLLKGFIRRTIPNKPTSKLQKYFQTERGKTIVYIRENLLKK